MIVFLTIVMCIYFMIAIDKDVDDTIRKESLIMQCIVSAVLIANIIS